MKLRITKNEGMPIHLVDTKSEDAIAYRRINELDVYSLSPTDVFEKVGLGQNYCNALIWYLEIQKNAELYKEFRIYKSSIQKRYSHKVVPILIEAKQNYDIGNIHKTYLSCNYGKGNPPKMKKIS